MTFLVAFALWLPIWHSVLLDCHVWIPSATTIDGSPMVTITVACPPQFDTPTCTAALTCAEHKIVAARNL